MPKRLELVFTHATLASAGISCRRVCLSVRLFVTNRYSTERARITQTTPHVSPETLVFGTENLGKTGLPPTEAPNAGEGGLNAAAVAENWLLTTRSAVNLVQSQVYHTECPPYCLLHAGRVAARRAGLSTTGELC